MVYVVYTSHYYVMDEDREFRVVGVYTDKDEAEAARKICGGEIIEAPLNGGY